MFAHRASFFFLAVWASLLSGCLSHKSDEELLNLIKETEREATEAVDASAAIERIDAVLAELVRREAATMRTESFSTESEYIERLKAVKTDPTVIYFLGEKSEKSLTCYVKRDVMIGDTHPPN